MLSEERFKTSGMERFKSLFLSGAFVVFYAPVPRGVYPDLLMAPNASLTVWGFIITGKRFSVKL